MRVLAIIDVEGDGLDPDHTEASYIVTNMLETWTQSLKEHGLEGRAYLVSADWS